MIRSRARESWCGASVTLTLAGRLIAVALVAALAAGPLGCGSSEDTPPAETVSIALPDLSGMQRRVAERITEAHRAALSTPSDAEAWGRFGKVCHVHRLYAPAIAGYRRANELAPADLRWAYFLARAMDLDGTAPAEEVLAAHERARVIRDDYPPLLVRLADLQAKQNLPAEARASYEHAIDLAPNLAVAHRGLGQVLLGQGDAAASVSHLERAAELVPTDAAALIALSQAYARLDRREDAESAAARASGLETIYNLPDPLIQEVGAEGISSFLCFQRAVQAMEAGAFASAIEDLLVVVDEEPDRAAAHQRLGTCYLQTGDRLPALDHLRRAVELDSTMVASRSQLASLLLEDGDMDGALAEYRAATATTPEDHELRAAYATTLGRAGSIDEALAEFRRAEGSGELSSPAYVNWGNVHRLADDNEAALDRYRRAVAADSTNGAAYDNIGIALVRLDRLEEAAIAYRDAARLAPSDPDVATRLATTLARIGKLDEALETFERLEQFGTLRASTAYNWGLVLKATGRPEEAVEKLYQSVASDPEYARAWYNLGVTLEALGRTDDAKAAYETLLELEPDDEVKARLDALTR